jgi:hypothetical protein
LFYEPGINIGNKSRNVTHVKYTSVQVIQKNFLAAMCILYMGSSFDDDKKNVLLSEADRYIYEVHKKCTCISTTRNLAKMRNFRIISVTKNNVVDVLSVGTDP